ncbi:unnamed protein product [Lampetra fluviatilis]
MEMGSGLRGMERKGGSGRWEKQARRETNCGGKFDRGCPFRSSHQRPVTSLARLWARTEESPTRSSVAVSALRKPWPACVRDQRQMQGQALQMLRIPRQSLTQPLAVVCQ